MNRLFDLLTYIRNGQLTGLSQVEFPFSDKTAVTQKNVIFSVLDLLRREGFIRGFAFKSASVQNQKKVLSHLTIFLKYESNSSRVIRNVQPVSTGGRRIFLSSSVL
jgi:ribosomal protein S8